MTHTKEAGSGAGGVSRTAKLAQSTPVSNGQYNLVPEQLLSVERYLDRQLLDDTLDHVTTNALLTARRMVTSLVYQVSNGEEVTALITPTAEIPTATPATCPRDTGIQGGCGMVDQPMLRDVPPATTDERFFRVVK